MPAHIIKRTPPDDLHILLISAFYPPENEVAAARISSFAKYWAKDGVKVTVLTRYPAFAGMQVPQHENIVAIRVRDPLSKLQRTAHQYANDSSDMKLSQATRGIVRHAKSVFRRLLWPDIATLWASAAIRRVGSLPRPDVIVASVGPLSTLRVAEKAAKHFQVPLIIDYRDPLSTNPYNSRNSVMSRLDSRLELRVASLSSAIVATSPVFVDSLGTLTNRPAFLVRNGYEPDTFPSDFVRSPRSTVRLVHTGRVYEGHNDFTPLFDAIHDMGSQSEGMPTEIRFYGTPSPSLEREIRAHGLEDYIKQEGLIPHAEVPSVQLDADVLLLLDWDSPLARGFIHAKFFEYIGAKRPILMLGDPESVVGELITQLGIGLCTTDPSAIKTFLEEHSPNDNRTTDTFIPPEISSQFTRESQANVFLDLVQQVVARNV